ncbi:MAG: hypothetical protein ACFE8L_00350 [Candidatus Hodarchaeota archaeon]
MLYSIFLFSHSGSLIYEKNFQDIDSGKIELFSSFFSAIKSFISELVLEGSKELKNIELGDYTIYITSLEEIKTDLVIIADKQDYRNITKLTPKFIRILLKFKQKFLDWDDNEKELKFLDNYFSELILSSKKLIEGTSLLEKPEHFLKSIWSHKKDLSVQEKKVIIQERELLIEKFNKAAVIEKLLIIERILELCERLKDERFFIVYQDELKKLKDLYKDTKLKLNYYLNKVKTSLFAALEGMGSKAIRDGDFKEIYINLYSFSTKLKLMSSKSKWIEYRDLALKLINKEEVSDKELTTTISSILNMNDNIEDYLN